MDGLQSQQLERILCFVQQSPNFETLSEEYQWQGLAQGLNAVGPQKSWESWRNMIMAWKTEAINRAAQLRHYDSRTDAEIPSLSERDVQLLVALNQLKPVEATKSDQAGSRNVLFEQLVEVVMPDDSEDTTKDKDKGSQFEAHYLSGLHGSENLDGDAIDLIERLVDSTLVENTKTVNVILRFCNVVSRCERLINEMNRINSDSGNDDRWPSSDNFT